MNSQRIKQNWSNLDPDKKEQVIMAMLELAMAFKMTAIVDKNAVRDLKSTKKGRIELDIDATKVYNIIVMFDVNEIHIIGNLSATKLVLSNAN
jgi:hypothetical protein